MANKKVCDVCSSEIVDARSRFYLKKDGVEFYAKVSEFRKTNGQRADICKTCMDAIQADGTLVIVEPIQA